MMYSHSEGLVEVHMADVATASRRVRKTNLGIQVGTVEVHLSAIFMNNLASLERDELSMSPESKR